MSLLKTIHRSAIPLLTVKVWSNFHANHSLNQAAQKLNQEFLIPLSTYLLITHHIPDGGFIRMSYAMQCYHSSVRHKYCYAASPTTQKKNHEPNTTRWQTMHAKQIKNQWKWTELICPICWSSSNPYSTMHFWRPSPSIIHSFHVCPQSNPLIKPCRKKGKAFSEICTPEPRKKTEENRKETPDIYHQRTWDVYVDCWRNTSRWNKASFHVLQKSDVIWTIPSEIAKFVRYLWVTTNVVPV